MSEREKKRGNNILWIEIARPILRGFRKMGMSLVGTENIKFLEIKLRNLLK
jgi:hypothetical protein